MASEQEELAAASRVRGKGYWIVAIAIGVAFIVICVVSAYLPERSAIHFADNVYGNCKVSDDASTATCTPLDDLDAYGEKQVKIGDATYGNCEGVGEAHVYSVLWEKTVSYDSILCHRLDNS